MDNLTYILSTINRVHDLSLEDGKQFNFEFCFRKFDPTMKSFKGKTAFKNLTYFLFFNFFYLS